MAPFLKKIQSQPFFLALMALFFVAHGYNQNHASVTAMDFAVLLGEYWMGTILVFLFGLLIYSKMVKAALFAFGLMFLELFFGPFHDGLKKISPTFFLAKYSVLLPLLLLLTVVFVWWLKKTHNSFHRLFAYLNGCFLLLLLIEVPSFFSGSQAPPKSGLPACTTCRKPDVYLIIADSYSDSLALADALHFNNGAFLSQLRNRGFHVVEGSHSNYNYTPFAMSSLLQMNYLPGVRGYNSDKHDRDLCAGYINRNPVVAFFRENGYAIKNASIFNLADEPTQARQNYLLLGKDLVRSQTFLQRLQRDLGYHLVTTLNLQSAIASYTFYTKKCNDKVLGLLRDEIGQRSQQPRFIYTHLLLPHYPYYYDQNGRERPLSYFKAGYEFDQQAYLEYLQYGNGLFLRLIDAIFKNATQPPIILLMGDHGFREFHPSRLPDPKYYYMNLNAVYLPDGNYQQFYKDLPAVNQFRALLNSAFGQHLPMLKDSAVLIQE
ncbi:alkaline phosphatase family protein [Flavisolibacter nicotianae]|uniref:hypothetical protein n=1 Tax=Flavisolibacter nicotianae TaxID=2364882 RepID=UPI000EAFC2E3|nr:hypothetical protein [Flavisolibacter nicotianae]